MYIVLCNISLMSMSTTFLSIFHVHIKCTCMCSLNAGAIQKCSSFLRPIILQSFAFFSNTPKYLEPKYPPDLVDEVPWMPCAPGKFYLRLHCVPSCDQLRFHPLYTIFIHQNHVCIYTGTPRMPPRVLASPLGGGVATI